MLQHCKVLPPAKHSAKVFTVAHLYWVNQASTLQLLDLLAECETIAAQVGFGGSEPKPWLTRNKTGAVSLPLAQAHDIKPSNCRRIKQETNRNEDAQQACLEINAWQQCLGPCKECCC
jgi:hypothetical protein